MAAQPARSKIPQTQKAKPAQERTHVMASVKLDVASHAKVSAVAALEGIDKSTWMSQVITEALKGVVVFDRRPGKAGGRASLADSDTGLDRQDDAA